MRSAFVQTLENNAAKNKNIILLTGDLGFTVFENFIRKYPNQYINMGVAEANMMGVASGMGLSGKITFVYSIAPFISLRPLEQIRNDVCMHKSNVKIIGVGAGLAYSHAGPTHHISEDIGILRTIPNIVIISPADPIEVQLAVDWAIRYKGPVYIRLGKKGETIIHNKKTNYNITKAILIRKGKRVLILSHGSITKDVVDSTKILDKKGISASVFSMPFIKPFDANFVKKSLYEYNAIFTVEEHNIVGALGSCVAEVIAEAGKGTTFKRIGINDQFCNVIGDHSYMKNFYGLSAEKIAEVIYFVVNKSKI